MKKRIEDLSIREIKTICKRKRYCNKNCPLWNHTWCCMGLKNMKEKELKEEIEL